MLDLDRDVVGDAGQFRGEPFDDAPRVRRTVEEIGIAEGDVLCARRDLLADVLEHGVHRNGVEPSIVDRHDRTMTAQMLASTRRIGAADDTPRAVRHLQLRVTRKGRQTRTIRDHRQLSVCLWREPFRTHHLRHAFVAQPRLIDGRIQPISHEVRAGIDAELKKVCRVHSGYRAIEVEHRADKQARSDQQND